MIFSNYSATSGVSSQQIIDLEKMATSLLAQSVIETRSVAGTSQWAQYFSITTTPAWQSLMIKKENAGAGWTSTTGQVARLGNIFYNVTQTLEGDKLILPAVQGMLFTAIGDNVAVEKLLSILKILGTVADFKAKAPVSSSTAATSLQNFLNVLIALPVDKLYATQI